MTTYKSSTSFKLFLITGNLILFATGFVVLHFSKMEETSNSANTWLAILFFASGTLSFFYCCTFLFTETSILEDRIIHKIHSNNIIELKPSDISEVKEYTFQETGSIEREVPRNNHFIEILNEKKLLRLDTNNIDDMRKMTEDLKVFCQKHSIKWTVEH